MDEDELQEDQVEDDGADDGESEGSDDSAPPKTPPASKNEATRINDLMSKWQAEQARANKLEAQLKARGGTEAPSADGGQPESAELDEFREFARENARSTLFASDPRLAEYGLTAEDIQGSTLAEMRASMKKHLKLVDGIEGRARNKILTEHGLDPDVATGARTEEAPSFSKMSDQEFDEFLAARESQPH